MTKRRIDLTDPDALRGEAQRLRGKAEAWSDEARRRLDAAPGGFITGRSGRTRSQDRKTNAAIERSLDLATLIVSARKEADRLEARAADLEAGGPARRKEQRAARDASDKDAAKTERQAMRDDPKRRLFIGCYPTGWMYCDRLVQKDGDYRRVAFLPYSSLVLEVETQCPAVLLPLIEANAADMQGRKGQQYQTAGNSWITLGADRDRA